MTSKQSFLSIKYQQNLSNRQTIEDVIFAFKKAGINLISFHKDLSKWGEVRLDSTPKVISDAQKQVFKIIDDIDFLVAEYTCVSVGTAIEIGYAYAKGKKIFALLKTGTEVPNVLFAVATQIYFYSTVDDLFKIAQQILTQVN